MTLSTQQVREAAASLLEAERCCKFIEPLTSRYDMTLADAYAIAQVVASEKVEAGAVVKGHKIGFTSTAMREMSGAEEPDFGRIFDYWFHDEGSAISLARMNRPAVEIELAFVLRKPLAGRHVNVADVIGATEFILPSIEIVDSRMTTTGGPRFVVINSIADGASCGGVVLGGRAVSPLEMDPKQVTGTLRINGEGRFSGKASAVMGSPLNAVAWLARKLAEFDAGMEAGHVVLSGSFIRAAPVAVGDRVSASFGELGEVSFELAR